MHGVGRERTEVGDQGVKEQMQKDRDRGQSGEDKEKEERTGEKNHGGIMVTNMSGCDIHVWGREREREVLSASQQPRSIAA